MRARRLRSRRTPGGSRAQDCRSGSRYRVGRFGLAWEILSKSTVSPAAAAEMREVGGARTDLAGADACAGCGLACCTNLPLTLELCELRLLCEDFISAVLHLAEPSSPSQGQSGGCGGGREREEEMMWWMEWIGSASCSGSTRLVQTQIVKMSNISNMQDTKIASLVTDCSLARSS